ncbi:MAG: DUF1990 domain-containing protein [Lewinellaceae bacterium]|nr:DUF1990 domain-containing protein [Saprospiraceae bacterium]MCB9345561.1 DUF1990 domain-containing protein [Lewinellaceae bacterium]
MFKLSRPTDRLLLNFLNEQKTLPFSYHEVNGTKGDERIPSYDNDLNVQVLGNGEKAWQAAREAIKQWKMFPGAWAYVHPAPLPIETDVVVSMVARVAGMWWINACRIVYVLDTENKFGFAYGTLPGHVEKGEELFMVEKLPDGQVQYVIKAFSKPRHWMARFGYPLARFHQRRFVADSKRSMLAFVERNEEVLHRTNHLS